MENGGLCVKQEPLELDWEEEEESFDYETEENNKSFDDGIDVGDSTEDFAVKLEPHVTIKQEDTELYHDLDHRVAGTSTQGKDIFKCNKCYISYENKFSYRNHVNSCQKQIVRFPLEGCEPWRGAGDMKESIKILEKSCFLNETWDETDLQSGDSTESFECLECENSYPNIKCFARHIYAHTFVKKPVEDQRHVCADCGKEFESKSKVDAHVKRSRKCANTPKVVFACLICRKIFTRKDNLRDHLKVHAGFPRTKKKYECKKCGKSFGSTTLLTIHARVHMGLRALSCKICKKTVTSKGALQKHMQVHKGEHLFQCNICPSTFAQKHALSLHYRTHNHDSSPPLFKCDHCPSIFKAKSLLEFHKHNHTQEFPCHLCSFSFNHLFKLSSHVQFTHPSAEKLPCTKCGKEQLSEEHLKMHMKVNHEGNPKIKMEQVKEIAPTQQFSFPTSQTQAPKTYTRKKKPITSLLTPKLEPIDTEIVIKQEQTST